MKLTLNDLREQLKPLLVLPDPPCILSMTHTERLVVIINRRDEQLTRYQAEREALLTGTLAALRAAYPRITDAQAQRIDAVFRQEVSRLNPDGLSLEGFGQLPDWYARTVTHLNVPPVMGPALSTDELEDLRDRLKGIRVTHSWGSASTQALLSITAGERLELLDALSEFDQSRVTLAREIRASLTLLSGTLQRPRVSDEEHAALLAALGALPIPEEFTTNAHAATLALVERYEDLTGMEGDRVSWWFAPESAYLMW